MEFTAPSPSQFNQRNNKGNSRQAGQMDDENDADELNSNELSLPPYQYPLQQYATTKWILILARSLNEEIPSDHDFNELCNIFKEEVIKWQNNKLALLDINQVYDDQHLCEYLIHMVENNENSPHHFGKKVFKFMNSVNTFIIHQLRTIYDPSQHENPSLLIRLAKWYGNSSPAIDHARSYALSWMKELIFNERVWNTKDSAGNNPLACLAANGDEELEALLALMKDNAIYQIDSIFDINDDGENCLDLCQPDLLKPFEISWHRYCRPYIHSTLTECLISDLANLCLSFIDADAKLRM